jgi:integrating conjugative element protein (TIGR03765 family)
MSRDWLARHQARLAAIQAIGMLVEAETQEDVAAVTAIANGLPILPASASDIAPALNISHIPVLISERGIEQ